MRSPKIRWKRYRISGNAGWVDLPGKANEPFASVYVPGRRHPTTSPGRQSHLKGLWTKERKPTWLYAI